MGAGGIGIWQLAIVLVIVLLLFGTKRLRNLGGDLGNAFKGFKHAVSDDDKSHPASPIENITGQETEATQTKAQKTESI